MTQNDEPKGSREVADALDVNLKTLQLWVREGYLRPKVTGEGRQRRIAWRKADIERAKRLRDRNGTPTLVAAFGPDFETAISEAWRMRDFCGDGDVVVGGAERGRIFRDDTSLRDVLRRTCGTVLVILR